MAELLSSAAINTGNIPINTPLLAAECGGEAFVHGVHSPSSSLPPAPSSSSAVCKGSQPDSQPATLVRGLLQCSSEQNGSCWAQLQGYQTAPRAANMQ